MASKRLNNPEIVKSFKLGLTELSSASGRRPRVHVSAQFMLACTQGSLFTELAMNKCSLASMC